MTDTSEQTDGMRLSIDTDLCSGHGRCYAKAPQWFDSDDVGYGVVLDQVISASDRPAVDDILGACPEGAISIKAAP